MFSYVSKHQTLVGWITFGLVTFSVLLYLVIADILEKSKIPVRPHIIVIIADDIGYNDFSFHGSNEVQTPNIDALAYHGIILNNLYTQPACSPSRAAFLTGCYPITTGLQGDTIFPGEDIHLPLDKFILPEHLNNLGYTSHLVGKWNLGHSKAVHTPTGRGFSSFLGFWNGEVDYFNYTKTFNGNQGYDLHEDLDLAWEAQGTYATNLFTNRALEIIDNHPNISYPLFLMVAHLSAHFGEQGKEALGVPNITDTNIRFSHIKDPRRRRYAENVRQLDKSLGKIISKLAEREMLEKSLILFLSDNGGATSGPDNNTGSNWPLRGTKNTYFEGGIKGSGVIFSPLLKKRSYVNKELIHLIDFLPTLYTAAGGDDRDLGKIDGLNQWDTLSKRQSSARGEFLIDIDEVNNFWGLIAGNGRYKLLNFSTREVLGNESSAHLGESGRTNTTPSYNISKILLSTTNVQISKLLDTTLTQNQILQLRAGADLAKCKRPENSQPLNCTKPLCLFDLDNDPCESINLAEENTNVVRQMTQRIEFHYRKKLVPQPPRQQYDPNSNPKLYNNTYCTWLEPQNCPKS